MVIDLKLKMYHPRRHHRGQAKSDFSPKCPQCGCTKGHNLGKDAKMWCCTSGHKYKTSWGKIVDKIDNIDMDKCPTCSSKAILRCMCHSHHRTCKNNHTWHVDWKKGKLTIIKTRSH